MDLRTTFIVTLSLAMLTIVAPFGLADDPQTGTAQTCADYNALYLVPGVTIDGEVDVDPGETFTVTSSSGTPTVDFYRADGSYIINSETMPDPIVPSDADFGIVCVGQFGTFPDAPAYTASYTYQDV